MPKSVLAARSWNPPGPAPREHLAYISDAEARMIDTGPPGPTYRVSNGRRTTMPMNSPRRPNGLRQLVERRPGAGRILRGGEPFPFPGGAEGGFPGGFPFPGGSGREDMGGGGDHPGAFPFPGGAEGGFPGDFPFPGGAGRDMGGGGGPDGGGFPGSMPPGWGGEARGFGHFSGRQGTQGGTGGGRGRGIPSFSIGGAQAYGGNTGQGAGSAYSGATNQQTSRSFNSPSGRATTGSGTGSLSTSGYDQYGNRYDATTPGFVGTRPPPAGVSYTYQNGRYTTVAAPVRESAPAQYGAPALDPGLKPRQAYYNSMQMQPKLSWAQAQKAPIGYTTINSKGQMIQKTAGGWAIIGGTGQRYAHQGAMQPSRAQPGTPAAPTSYGHPDWSHNPGTWGYTPAPSTSTTINKTPYSSNFNSNNGGDLSNSTLAGYTGMQSANPMGDPELRGGISTNPSTGSGPRANTSYGGRYY